jgi:uncharacterized membrane protein YhaH (DUF805 family)
MFDAIKYNLRHLTDFSGRDARPTFWYYVLFLVVVNFVLGLLVSIPFTAASIGAAAEAARSGASEEAIEAQVLSQVAGGMGPLLYASIVVTFFVTALFVASFVRRVHDTGNSGWWAVVPVATQLASLVIGLQTSAAIADAMAAVRTPEDIRALEHLAEPTMLSLLPWIGYIVVIVFGVLPSQPNPNRFGEVPVGV